ncbi:MAG: 2-amino-4-hydroxy-6-hydroxymethyldihydropteridine diphosphokinase [Desulfovibrio sp.]|jgi:2-amino-4-hydroxy-6-hydroxymethyldihydropteridine diphosphokinase|nr:2-amino-4-hydroxy-6-hydroxymethyldihydropteridine diphosphokinase [Desulfovibrio sp.]
MNPERIQVFLSLGSNCAGARQMLARAREAIAALPGAGIIAKSPVYLTEPQGYSEQPWFSNQVIALAVAENWRPPALLTALLAIENSLGRKRDLALRFGPRKIDIDLLLFGDEKSSDPDCVIPHPRMLERAFVLCPLLDIAPQINIGGRPASDWLAALPYKKAGEKIWQ